jgi:hypothetical protein
MTLRNADDYFGRHKAEATSFRPPRKKTVIQIPGSGFPHSDFENMTWITLVPKEVKGVSTAGRAGSITLRSSNTMFKFAAPKEIFEVHSHAWQEYESFNSAVLEKIKTYKTGYQQVSGVFQRGSQEIGKLWDAAWTGKFLSQLEKSAIRVSEVDVPQFKIDTPLTWTGSARRLYNFEFILADANGGADMVDAVQQIQKYSAARLRGDIGFDFPYVWEIKSEPNNLINVPLAACTSVQPVWQTPFQDGLPYWCTLNLSFTDMSPLYSETLEGGSIVNVLDYETEKKKLEERSEQQTKTAENIIRVK